MKDKFIWVHIERTAGGTFSHHVLRKIYKNKEMKLSNKDEFHICNSRMFGTPKKFFKLDPKKFPEERINQLTVIGGHMCASKYLYLNRPYVTFVRDPVDRTISNYYIWKQSVKRALDPECKKRGRTNREIMEMLRDGLDIVEFSKIFSNHMSYMIDIDLKHFKFIGITENFDQDVYKFGRIFNVAVPKHIPRHHVLSYQKPDINIRRRIRKNMEQDYELYKKALEINKRYT